MAASTAVKQGTRRLDHGLFLDAACEPTTQVMLAAWLKTLPQDQTAVDGVSALRLWGVDPDTFAKDLNRYEQLTAAGVLEVRVAKAHLRRPREVVRRVHAALVSRGFDGPGPHVTREWCAAFESWT